MNPEETLAVWRAEEGKVRERLALTAGCARGTIGWPQWS